MRTPGFTSRVRVASLLLPTDLCGNASAAALCPNRLNRFQVRPLAIALRLKDITHDQNRIVSYSMDAQGRTFQALTNQVFDGNGALLTYQQTDYTFDSTASNPAFFLTRIKNTWWWKVNGIWTSKVLTQNDYTYNVAGMRLTNAISDVTGLVRTETYGYDELYRLTSVNYGDTHTQSYTFDPMGNRLSKVNDGVTENYTFNNANMLLTRGANNYTNDLDGNTLTGGGRTNTWDSQNRLVNCVNGGNTSNFTYASDGIRHRTVLGANTTDYICDGPMFVREKLNGVVSATYLIGMRGPEYRRDDSSGTVRWYCFDGLGSVLGEVDPSGNLTASRTFDVYGAVRTSAGTSTSRHKFVGSLGHPSEDETGLVYMQARLMDPVVGRFVSQDPALKGSNWYLYCPHNPVTYVDRTGRDEEIISIEVGMSGAVEIEGAGYQITAFAIRTGQEMRILITMIRSNAQGLSGGVARLQALLTATREWAQTQEIIKLVIEGRTSRSGARFAEKAADLIRKMGDKGQLIDDGLWSQVYWLIGE
jgi:RHS repeat-associated protein